MSPHDGCGAWIPIPRKLSPDSSRTIVANWLEPLTRLGASVLGRLGRALIRRSLAPRAQAAPPYSRRRLTGGFSGWGAESRGARTLARTVSASRSPPITAVAFGERWRPAGGAAARARSVTSSGSGDR